MSDYRDWKVGDKVVMVDCSQSVQFHHLNWRRFIPGLAKFILTHHLEAGEIYEIETITTHTDRISGRQIVCIFVTGFRFNEVKYVGFPAPWFRKVEPRKTSIAIFTAMLNRTDVREEA